MKASVNSLFSAKEGVVFDRASLYQLFTGDTFGNTPQKGIHWYPSRGSPELIVIASTEASGNYRDRFIDQGRSVYLYYLMISHRHTTSSRTNRSAMENSILLNQGSNEAPILLLISKGKNEPYVAQGWFRMETHCLDDRENHSGVDSVLLVRGPNPITMRLN